MEVRDPQRTHGQLVDDAIGDIVEGPGTRKKIQRAETGRENLCDDLRLGFRLGRHKRNSLYLGPFLHTSRMNLWPGTGLM